MSNDTLVCSLCKSEKSKSDFRKRSDRPRGHQSYCKACASIKVGSKPRTPVKDGYKRCRKCKQELEKTQANFHVDNSRNDGLACICKVCRSSPEEKARGRVSALGSYYRHRDKRLLQVAKYRESNREAHNKRSRDWLSRNHVRANIIHDRRRMRKRGLFANFTAADWERCLEYWGYKCCVCGRVPDAWHLLAKEHWIPVSDAREDNPGSVPENILPMCHSKKGNPSGWPGCNNSKGSKDAAIWLTQKYGKRKANKILDHINDYFAWLEKEHSPCPTVTPTKSV